MSTLGASQGMAALAAGGPVPCVVDTHSIQGVGSRHCISRDAAQCLQNSRGPESEQAALRLPWSKLQPIGSQPRKVAASVPGGSSWPSLLAAD